MVRRWSTVGGMLHGRSSTRVTCDVLSSDETIEINSGEACGGKLKR